MAQEVLFITKDDIVRYTALNGNVDVDKYLQFIQYAQDSDVQVLLGTKLYERLKTDIRNNTLAEPYLSLLNDKIKPIVVHYSMVQFLAYAPYTIGNKGIYKGTSEVGQVVPADEVAMLIEKCRSLAEHYSQRFIDFMCFNNNLFPEYNANTNDDVYPTTNNDFGGWVI